ncbi:MAG: recombinase family protein [Ruminococcus sp.]
MQSGSILQGVYRTGRAAGLFANQIAYYTDYINEKEEYQLAGIFSDEGISGTGTRKRAGFRSMIAACEAGKVDLVITKSISRFATKYPGLSALCKIFEEPWDSGDFRKRGD